MPKYIFEIEEEITSCFGCPAYQFEYGACYFNWQEELKNESTEVQSWCPLQLVDDNAKEVKENE